MKVIFWVVWLLLSLALAGFYGYKMFVDDDKKEFIIGEATHGHYQIEMACTACHTEAFGGKEILQNACLDCHSEELELAHDSHPKKKFTDPRNADLLEVIDARYCVSCHTEHQNEQTHPMGLTLPKDYCYHCHEEVLEERESHQGLAFDSCATAGCHNYHDNRALYEEFLVNNAGGQWLNAIASIGQPTSAAVTANNPHKTKQVAFAEKSAEHPDIHQHWAATSHASAGVNCGGCHSANDTGTEWLDKPGIEQCQECHANEADGFLKGKHGMRLAQGLSPMTPSQSPLAFKDEAADTEHGCNSCHSAHKFDTQYAAKEACLTCHNDEHSLAFEQSPHGQLLQKAVAGVIPVEQSVTCATCHMPRVEHTKAGKKLVRVEHNQNDNLRPNEKMIRPVCMQCHNLEFAIDALADPALIKNNFNGKPHEHIPSIDWALKRVK